MNYSTIKQIKDFCESLHSQPDWREVVQNIESGVTDFEIDNVRFISDEVIQETLADELSNDEYVLGCFHAWVIAKATGWPVELIEIAQQADAYDKLGKAMTREHIEKLADIYASADGYGHHFNGYDFSEEELQVNEAFYHVFDNR